MSLVVIDCLASLNWLGLRKYSPIVRFLMALRSYRGVCWSSPSQSSVIDPRISIFIIFYSYWFAKSSARLVFLLTASLMSERNLFCWTISYSICLLLFSVSDSNDLSKRWSKSNFNLVDSNSFYNRKACLDLKLNCNKSLLHRFLCFLTLNVMEF